MFTDQKFNLTDTHKKKGVTLTIYWAGGLSQVTTWKDGQKEVQRVQKSVQSVHHFTSLTINHWLSNPASGYWKPGEWIKRSETVRIQEHINDYIHDAKIRGVIINWTLE